MEFTEKGTSGYYWQGTMTDSCDSTYRYLSSITSKIELHYQQSKNKSWKDPFGDGERWFQTMGVQTAAWQHSSADVLPVWKKIAVMWLGNFRTSNFYIWAHEEVWLWHQTQMDYAMITLLAINSYMGAVFKNWSIVGTKASTCMKTYSEK